MKKIAYIFLIAANFGLPLNSWFSFVLLVVGGAVVLVGEITSDQRLWRWAGIVTISVIVLRLVIPSHEINEGHAVFDPSEKSVLYNALPRMYLKLCGRIMRRWVINLKSELRHAHGIFRWMQYGAVLT